MICSDLDPQKCRLTQNVLVKDNKGHVSKILSLMVQYVEDARTRKRGPFLSVRFPLGVDLRSGAIIKIDGFKQHQLTFLQCVQQGCDAGLRVKGKVLDDFLQGRDVMKVGFRPWNSKKTVVVKTSLKGFLGQFKKLK